MICLRIASPASVKTSSSSLGPAAAFAGSTCAEPLETRAATAPPTDAIIGVPNAPPTAPTPAPTALSTS